MFDQQGLVSLSDVQANVDKPSDKQHVFVEVHFSKPTFCDLPSCQGFIWGLTKQGFSCSACHYATHKRCMTMAMESELCPGIKIKHLKNVNKMPLKKKLKRVNAYLERLVPFAPIPNNIEFEHFLQICISDFSSINSAIPNLFESFKNTNISRENIASMLTTLAANESSAYFIISLLHIFAGDENNRDIIVKCGAVEVVLSRMMPEEGISPYTILSPSLSFLDELMKNGHSVADILLHVSTSPIEAAALLDKTNVGGSLEFIARKRNAVAVQNFLNSFVALAKTDYVAKDDLLQTKIARILASVYRDEKAKQYVERCGGHELVVKAATRQLVNLHNEITDAEVRFDYDGLLYDSPLCRVYRGTYSKQRVAIKVFSRDSLGFDQQGFNKEIALMNIIQSENAVKCYGVNTKGENPFVVMEFFTNGSLNDFVTLNPFDIPIRTKVYLMIGAAKGIRFLHEKSIIHRDIKTQNFMVGDEFLNCKVIDFGVSRVDTQNAKKTIIGTPVYMAPEIMHDKPYTFSADSYSFGLVMWEMIAKKIPYFDIHPMRVAEHILKNRPTIPEDCDPLLASTMTACWDPEPTSRPLFDQIIDLLCQFSFPLGVKRPDHPDSDVVTFANLYTVLDTPTYKRIFAELDVKTCAALREVCKLYKDVVDSNFKKNGVEQINIKGEQ